ncbi:TPA: molybdopterin-guanine dinucleotide biosynthesis protein B, partial [Candidatus Bipolaricaulota bacterium]|nr:molybdopterin-guanine dinucleotide biosynthesis protein B [Candidatus Bipolaricaulota bacterium]
MDGAAKGIVAFIGRKGSGKTTFLTRLIPVLVSRGHRVGVIKRVPPHFELDQKGKDSFRLKEAGASAIFLSSERRVALIEDVPEEPTPEEIASKYLQHMDIILVESFKRSALPKVEVYRKGQGEGPLFRDRELELGVEVIALVTDDPELELPPGVERFSFEEPERVADLIEARFLKAGRPGPGKAKMVDVGGKPETERTALAQGKIKMSPSTLRKLLTGELEKGDILAVARVAAIMGAKRA